MGERVTELRTCRRQIGVTQAELADMLGVALNSFRMWDSGLRPTPKDVLEQARLAAAAADRDRRSLNLPGLAKELNVHGKQPRGQDASRCNSPRGPCSVVRSDYQRAPPGGRF